MLRPLRIALDRRRHRHGDWAELFESYQGDEVVSLDCETSGLDPKNDSIISVGAVVVDGCRTPFCRSGTLFTDCGAMSL